MTPGTGAATAARGGEPALRAGAAAVDLTGRGEVVLLGRDRVALLQGLLTNDVKALAPGAGCRAALLTPKGKMRADMAVLRTEDELILDCEPGLAGELTRILEGYVVFSEVALEDRTDARAVLHVEGPRAQEVLEAAGLSPLPDLPYASRSCTLAATPVLVVCLTRAGRPGWDVRGPRASAGALMAALLSAGAEPAEPEALEAGRIEAGIPRWGAELDETVLPDEAGLTATAVSYTKGCYVGQETVARIRTYGHVNRHLVGLLLPLEAAVAPGAPIRAGEAAVGAVTSVAALPHRRATVALGYVKREWVAPGTGLVVDGVGGALPATVTSFPLAG